MDFDDFVLAAATADLDDEPAARPHADCVEFRMDLADDPLSQLAAYDGELPLIATNRAEWEGGEAADEGRLDALRGAAEHEAVAAVDVELRSCTDGPGEDAVAHARDHDCAAVVSIHDFEGTPLRQDMRAALDAALDAGDVGKLAVTAHDRADTLDLLTVTHEYAVADEPVATMAMGEAGRHTRAVAPLYGARIGYAPVDAGEATAPGQFDLATLRRLYDRLQSVSEDSPTAGHDGRS